MGNWRVEPYECMVDLAFLSRTQAKRWEPVMTAEIEAYSHKVELPNGDGLHDNGYFWDLYKLLHFPSPCRIFLARTSKSRIDDLCKNLVEYAQRYSHLFEGEARLFIAVRGASGVRSQRA
jgi:hypothetical protein